MQTRLFELQLSIVKIATISLFMPRKFLYRNPIISYLNFYRAQQDNEPIFSPLVKREMFILNIRKSVRQRKHFRQQYAFFLGRSIPFIKRGTQIVNAVE